MNKLKKIIIFKNDRIGDLITSIPAINLIIKKNLNKKIIIFLSEINSKMDFLFKKKNVKIIQIKYKLSYLNRLMIIYFFLTNKIFEAYIIRPKNFFFLLPLIFFFKKIKFYGLCINGKKKYKRPSIFLRKFLTKLIINDRHTKSIRISRRELQLSLVNDNWKNIDINENYLLDVSNILRKILPQKFCLIHYKKSIFEELGWCKDGLEVIINELFKHYDNVVLINDINSPIDNSFFKTKYNWFDFKKGKSGDNNSKVLYLENIEGYDMANTIKLSEKTIACHGTITLLGNLIKTPILDLFYCNISNTEDFYRCKNSFHEHKPKNDYDFIIPKQDIYKTIKKMKFSLIK
jgi:hypothetical protein